MRNYFSQLVEALGNGWNRFFYTPVDPLPTAVLRIAVGLLAIYWQLSYTPDLARFMGANGMFPLESISQFVESDNSSWSLFAFFSDSNGIWIAHALSTLVLLAFTLGLKTRIATPLALYVFLSYVHRAPMITGLAEHVFAFLLFYLCFAPCGAVLSIDRWLANRRGDNEEPAPSVAANISLRLIQIHLAVAYGMMGLAKMSVGSDTWWLGEAIWWLAVRPETRLIDLTGLLSDYPLLLNAWTHAVVLFEVAFALLIWNRWTRPLLLALSAPMYLALALITGQMMFCLLIIVAGVAFVPAATLHQLRSAEPVPAVD